MKRVAIVVALLVLGSTGFAQGGRSAIAGRVTTDQGDPAAGVTIQAKEMATGNTSSVVAGKSGEFRLANLAPGTYEISVPQMGLRTSRYAQPNVVIEAGKTLTFNIVLMPNNFGIVGDDAAFLQMYEQVREPEGPRAADGRRPS